MNEGSAKLIVADIVATMVEKVVSEAEEREESRLREDDLKNMLERASRMKDRIEGVSMHSLATIGNVDTQNFKRSMPARMIDNSQEEFAKPGVTKILTSRKSKDISDSNHTSKTRLGLIDCCERRSPKVADYADSLTKFQARRNHMDCETPVVARISSGSLSRLQRDSDNGRLSSSSRGSIELRHPKIVIDKGDLCDCPNHSRTSLSLCRQSMRKSTPLQEVQEGSDCEEESIHEVDSKIRDLSPQQSPARRLAGNAFDIETQK